MGASASGVIFGAGVGTGLISAAGTAGFDRSVCVEEIDVLPTVGVDATGGGVVTTPDFPMAVARPPVACDSSQKSRARCVNSRCT